MAPVIAGVLTSTGAVLGADQKVGGGPSVLYDAVVLLLCNEEADAFAEDPAVRVLVHPECPFDVVAHADLVGSTEYIIEQVRQAPPGSSWAIGTAIHLAHRLALEQPAPRARSPLRRRR